MAIGVALVWGWAIVVVALLAKSAFGEWLQHQRFVAELHAKVEQAQPTGVHHVPRGISRSATPKAAEGPPTHARDLGLPDDLEAYVGQWDEAWARDDETRVVRDKFVELYTGDVDETWQKVRRAVGIGALP